MLRARAVRAATVAAVTVFTVASGATGAAAAPRRQPARQPDFSVGAVTVAEPAAGETAYATFTVSLSSAPSRRMRVLAHTRNGTARRQRGDYDRVVTVLEFTPSGPLSQTVPVPVHGDDVDEPAETFELRLRNRRELRVATATIVPPPPPLAVTVANASVFEPGPGGLSDGTVTLAPVAPLAHDLTVDYEVVGVDATAGDDYWAQTGTLVFPAGSTTPQEVVATVVGDDDVESDETLRVEFTAADHSVTLTPGFATVTILDDDSGSNQPPVDPQ